MSNYMLRDDMFVNSTVYHDLPLPDSKTHIRLLTAEIVDDVLHCSLSVTTLHQAPAYSALSYAWRATAKTEESPYHSARCPAESSEDQPRPTIVSGNQCQIFGNLHEALCVIARQPGGTLLWADAICINQSDLSEREKQVAIMGEIYSKAEGVIVWLGRADQSTDKALPLMTRLGQIANVPSELAMILPHSLQQAQVERLLPRNIYDDESWRALGALFCRTWFSRAWVMQEVILARSIIVLCGDFQLDWQDLCIVSGHLSKWWYAAFRDPPFRLPVRPTLGAAAKLRSTRRSIEALLNTAGDAQAAAGIFLDTVVRAREFNSSDARDKVYSCYGLGRRFFSQSGLQFPEANYSNDFTAGNAFTLTVRTILRASNDLSVLAHAESMHRSCDVSTPSWVPDWTVLEKLGLGVTGYKRYWAAGKSRQQVAFADISEIILCLKAEYLCSIVATGDTKKDIRDGQLEKTCAVLEVFAQNWEANAPTSISLNTRATRIEQVLPLGTHHTTETCVTLQSAEECLWRTLIADTDHDTRRCPANDLLGPQFRSWLAPRDPSGRFLRILAPYHADSDMSNEGGPRLPAQSGSSNCNITSRSSEFDTAYAIRQALRLFCTDDGRLGLGAVASQVGDSIWIMPGSRVPLILRERITAPASGSRARYSLVGAAYVHGVMHGEILRRRVPATFETTIEIE